MHIHEIETLTHSHRFGETHATAERRTILVAIITAGTMVAEIIVGWLSGSMALLADGWHMGTHMFALGIAAFAYRFARTHSDDPSFSFGTGKVASLAGFTSAIVLAAVAASMVAEALKRFFNPVEIQFSQALVVASIGFVVNVVSAVLLHGSGHESHDHDHHHDHNLKAALIHVIADALTSLLAIAALTCVYFWNLRWLDPAVALVGAALIAVWAIGLLRESGRTLLDAGVDTATREQIKALLEADSDNRVSDLHVWYIGGKALSVAASITTHFPRAPEHYRALLEAVPEVKHTTIEVVGRSDEPCIPIREAPSETLQED
jgi:cation diffusion facilitator family transporter